MTLARLVVRNLTRNHFRFVATVLAVAVSTVTFVLLRTAVWAWTAAGDAAPRDRIVTRNKVSFAIPLALRYADDLGAHAHALHVTGWTFATWFGGRDPLHPKQSFATVAVDERTYFELYDEVIVSPDVLARWKNDRRGVIVGDVLARRMGWKPGDVVRLESGVFPELPIWEFTVDGVYDARAKNIDRSWFIIHWSYVNDALERSRRDQVGWITSRVDARFSSAEVTAAIDRIFEDRDVQTMSQDEGTFHKSVLATMSALLRAIDVVSLGVLVIMALVVGNTMAMAVRERSGEYAILRAAGFLPRHVAAWVVGEAVLISLLGGAVGAGLSVPLVDGLAGPWIEENLVQAFHWYRTNPSTLAAAFALSALSGALASAVPAWQLSRMSVVAALRRIG